MLKKLKDYTDGLIALFYPQFCVVCGTELNIQNKHLCFTCQQALHFTHFEKYEEATMADYIFWGRLNVQQVYALLYYEKGNSTQKLLHHIKYHEGKELGEYMGEMLGKKLSMLDTFSTVDAIVPIPLHSKKQFTRGYNQSLAIAKGIHSTTNIPIVEALYRKKHDESQTRKTKEERYKNVQGKFAAYPQVLANYKNIVIVDDVLTTGSTLEFATRAILTTYNTIKVNIATIAIAHQ